MEIAELYLNKFGMIGEAFSACKLNNGFIRIQWKSDRLYKEIIKQYGLPPSWIKANDPDIIPFTTDVKKLIKSISNKYNRSESQTAFLFELLNNNAQLLMQLETKIKRNHIAYCPSNVEEINKILILPIQ